MDQRETSGVAAHPDRLAPRPVRAASAVLGIQGVILAGLVAATVMWEELLVRAWAADSESASAVVAQSGLQGLAESPIAVPAFVPVAVVSFLTLVPLGAVLAAMLLHRARWVRSWLTVVAGLGLGFSVVAVQTGPPAGFVVLGVLAGISCVALVACLWHPATGRWLTSGSV